MNTVDKVLVTAALVLGIMDAVGAKGPLSRFSPAGVAIVLLSVVLLRQGGVINF